MRRSRSRVVRENVAIGTWRLSGVGWDKAASADGPPFEGNTRVAMVGRRSLRELVPPYDPENARFPTENPSRRCPSGKHACRTHKG
jgi:hypothetical protein